MEAYTVVTHRNTWFQSRTTANSYIQRTTQGKTDNYTETCNYTQHGLHPEKNTEAHTITIETHLQRQCLDTLHAASQKTTVTHKKTQLHADTVTYRDSDCLYRDAHNYTHIIKQSIHTYTVTVKLHMGYINSRLHRHRQIQRQPLHTQKHNSVHRHIQLQARIYIVQSEIPFAYIHMHAVNIQDQIAHGKILNYRFTDTQRDYCNTEIHNNAQTHVTQRPVVRNKLHTDILRHRGTSMHTNLQHTDTQ